MMHVVWLSWLLACGDVETVDEPTSTSAVAEVSNALEKTIQQGPVEVQTVLAPDSVRLGDPFELTLKVTAYSAIEVEMPPFGEALGRLSIVDFTPREELSGDSMVYIQRYGLQPNRSGEVVIPSLRVGYRNDVQSEWEEVLTEPLVVQVESILPSDADLVYQDARSRLSALPVEQPWMPWAIGGALTLGFSGLGLWWHRNRRVLVNQLSAYEVAQRSLQSVRDELALLTDDDSVDQVYADLSIICRAYLEGCFGVMALEQTTEELRERLPIELQKFSSPNRVTEDEVDTLLQFLVQCDRIKFAGLSSTLTEASSACTMVEQWIERVHQRTVFSESEEKEQSNGVV